MKNKFTKITAMLLCAGMISQADLISVQAAEQSETAKDPDNNVSAEIVFANEVVLREYQAEIDGSVYAGKIEFTGNKGCTVNGTLNCGSVSGETVSAAKTTVSEEKIPDHCTQLSDKTYYETVYDRDVKMSDTEYDLSVPAYVKGKLELDQVRFKNKGYICVSDDIICNAVSDGEDEYSMFMYSENGDIRIQGTELTVNGVLYAPNGTVELNAKNLTVNGMIIADKIEFGGTKLTVKDTGDYHIIYKTSEDGEEVNDMVVFKQGEWYNTTDDSDGDGLADYMEAMLGTDVNSDDTDGDKLSDYYETTVLGTDPTKADSDGNNIKDGDEDADGDGLSNLEEYRLKTDPLNKDSDYDGLTDGEEVNKYRTDPLNEDSDGDTLNDGDDTALGLDPHLTDTDGNSIPDNEEVFRHIINEDHKILSGINKTDYDYGVSLDITCSGNVMSDLKVGDTPYANVIENSAILGKPIEIKSEKAKIVKNVTVKFRINERILEDLDVISAANVNYLQRYLIFKFDETQNALLPVETEFDYENNILSCSTDSFGTYCVMNMKTWFENMGYKIDSYKPEKYDPTDPVEPIGPIPIDDDPEMYLYGDNKTEYSLANEEKPAPEIKQMSGSNEEIDLFIDRVRWHTVHTEKKDNDVDVVYILQIHGREPEICENNLRYIKNMSKELFSVYRSARVAIMIYGMDECEYLLSPNGTKWFTDKTDVNITLEKIKYKMTTKYCERGEVYNNLIYKTDFRSDSYRFVFNMPTGNSILKDPLKDAVDMCRKVNVNYSELIMYGYSYYSGSYQNELMKSIEKSGGKLFQNSKQVDSAHNTYVDMLNHIYDAVPNEYTTPPELFYNKDEQYTILTPTGWKGIELKERLKANGAANSDEDALTDWEETDYESGLILWGGDGTPLLPTVSTYLQNLGRTQAYNWAALAGIWNQDPYIEVLPIKSDPTMADSDGDGIIDCKDKKPLVVARRLDLLYDYISVLNDNTLSYGGSQDWFSENESNISKSGCGLIASTDLILYLLRSNPSYYNENLYNKLVLDGDFISGNEINLSSYMRIVLFLNQNGFDIGNNGLNTLSLPFAFNNFAVFYKWKLSATWNGNSYYPELIKINKIVDQVNNNVPVILRVGDRKTNDNNSLGLKTYRGTYFTNVLEKDRNISRIIEHHFVTVTGVIYNGDDIWLQISNYGNKEYIDFSEYLAYASQYDNYMDLLVSESGSNILLIDNYFPYQYQSNGYFIM